MDRIAESIARIAAEVAPVAVARARTVALDLPADLSEALDRWIAVQADPRPSRDEAVRYALRGWLGAQGYLEPGDCPGDAPSPAAIPNAMVASTAGSA